MLRKYPKLVIVITNFSLCKNSVQKVEHKSAVRHRTYNKHRWCGLSIC